MKIHINQDQGELDNFKVKLVQIKNTRKMLRILEAHFHEKVEPQKCKYGA